MLWCLVRGWRGGNLYRVAVLVEHYFGYVSEGVGLKGVTSCASRVGAFVHVALYVGIFGLLELAMILLEGRVAEYGLQEVAADGQGGA